MIKKVYMKRTGVMTKISFCLIFAAILAVPCELSAEPLDNLPPIPYAQTPLIYSACHKLPKQEFIKSLIGRKSTDDDNDSFLGDEKFGLAMLKRGGAVGRQMAEDTRTKECTKNKLKGAMIGDKLPSYCAPVIATTKMLFARDYYRAAFSSMGFSFDKSLIMFANDCYTYGSCTKAAERISIDISKNEQSLVAVLAYIEFCTHACNKIDSFDGCSANSPDGKKPYFLSFLSKDVIEACQMMKQNNNDL